MYYEVGIQKLSDNQLSKLRNGHPIRVKLGNHHKICLSIQQLKKLNKASKKGSASTISFDPYQLEAHGSGILGDIGRKAKAFIQKYKLQDVVNPVINRVKKESHKGVSKLSNYAHSKINDIQPVDAQGEGLFGDVLGMINPTIGNVAKTFGLGVARKHTAPKKTKSKVRKGKGILGSLGNMANVYAVNRWIGKGQGEGILTDLAKTAVKSVANKGIDVGADFLKDKVSGMGNKRLADIRRIRGRRAPPAKRSFGGSGVDGGALYPGGYGGGVC